VPRTRTTKKLAQRIDLEYFKKRGSLRRWRFLLSVALPAVAILWLAWYAIRADRRVYSAGSLAPAHALLTKQCESCHLTQAGFFSEKVADQKCMACHDGAIHHAAQEFTPPCASCHAEHRGAIRLAATRDSDCTRCHSSLTTHAGSTNFVRNIDSFAGDHPEFAVLRAGRGDPGTIQLNHYRHLQPNLPGPNGSHVQMVCTDCHRSAADANAPWPFGDLQSQLGTTKTTPPDSAKAETVISSQPRAYMAPATYAHTCAACHSLQFDKRLTDAVPHDTPEAIHPFVVAKLQAYIAAHPADLRVPRDPSRDLPEQPIVADYRLLAPQQWVGERTAEAEQLLWRKTCKECHALVAGEGPAMPKIAPSNITSRYFPHAEFDHSQHGLVDCVSCHATAESSQQSSDLLVPGIATCRSCHKPGAESAESRCFECHTYHDPAQRKPAHSNFSLTDLVGGLVQTDMDR
jgi:predicted CXXCH cytochrome family protein